MVALKQGSVPDVIANKLDHLLILTSGTEQYLITCTNKKYKFLLTTTLTISARHTFSKLLRTPCPATHLVRYCKHSLRKREALFVTFSLSPEYTVRTAATHRIRFFYYRKFTVHSADLHPCFRRRSDPPLLLRYRLPHL